MNPHKKSFVIVSTSHKRKGIPFLLELFKQLNPNKYELLIAGKPSIKTGLPHVKFLGYLTNPAELFAAADFTIHPSIFEPFGQVISESLACGTPVVLSKNTGWSPILPPAYGKVLNDFDITTWKKTLEEIEPKDFKIPSDFSSLWKLSTEEHIEKMLAFYGKG